jgi:hypothetical protein
VRKWLVASVAPPRTEVSSPAVLSRIQDSAVPKMSARKIAMREMKPRNATAHTIVKTMTAKATHWSCGQ